MWDDADLFPGGERALWPTLASPLPCFRRLPAAPAHRGGTGVRVVGQGAGGTQAARCRCYLTGEGRVWPVGLFILFCFVLSKLRWIYSFFTAPEILLKYSDLGFCVLTAKPQRPCGWLLSQLMEAQLVMYSKSSLNEFSASCFPQNSTILIDHDIAKMSKCLEQCPFRIRCVGA